MFSSGIASDSDISGVFLERKMNNPKYKVGLQFFYNYIENNDHLLFYDWKSI